MRRGKKLIIVGVLAAVILAGSIGGAVLAADGEDEYQPGAGFTALWDKVAALLQGKGVEVTPEQLQEAFTEAHQELRPEMPRRARLVTPEDIEAMRENMQARSQERLARMVEEGKLTQEQADEFTAWWGAKPEALENAGPGFASPSFRGRMPRLHGPMLGGFGGQCPAEE